MKFRENIAIKLDLRIYKLSMKVDLQVGLATDNVHS